MRWCFAFVLTWNHRSRGENPPIGYDSKGVGAMMTYEPLLCRSAGVDATISNRHVLPTAGLHCSFSLLERLVLWLAVRMCVWSTQVAWKLSQFSLRVYVFSTWRRKLETPHQWHRCNTWVVQIQHCPGFALIVWSNCRQWHWDLGLAFSIAQSSLHSPWCNWVKCICPIACGPKHSRSFSKFPALDAELEHEEH